MNAPLKIVFFGTPDPAREILEALIASNHEIVGVITQPDKRRGRGKTLMPTPVKESALTAEIEVYEPSSKAELIDCVDKTNADVGIVVAYGRILPAEVLEHFKFGCVNVHYSVLPRWRGAAPVERAILAGDETTGVSIMKMDEGLDTGPVYLHRRVDILPTTNSVSLFRSINAIAADLLLVVLDNLGLHQPIEQSGEQTYAHKLEAKDFFFDSTTSVFDIDKKVRAGALVKGAWTNVNNETFRIISASKPMASKVEKADVGTIDKRGRFVAIDGEIELKQVQVPGKQVMEFSAWANGVSPEKFPLRIDN